MTSQPSATAERSFLDSLSPEPGNSYTFPCSELSQWESVTLTSSGVHNCFSFGTLGQKYRLYSVELQPLQLGSRFEATKICKRTRFRRDLSLLSPCSLPTSCLEIPMFEIVHSSGQRLFLCPYIRSRTRVRDVHQDQ